MEVSGRKKNTPNGTACPLRVILGDFLGLCRANVGPFWVYVGPMLGHLVGLTGFPWRFRREGKWPHHKDPCDAVFGIVSVVVSWGWANAGPMLCHMGVYVRPSRATRASPVRYVPCLPHKVLVDVAKYNACHGKSHQVPHGYFVSYVYIYNYIYYVFYLGIYSI